MYYYIYACILIEYIHIIIMNTLISFNFKSNHRAEFHKCYKYNIVNIVSIF